MPLTPEQKEIIMEFLGQLDDIDTGIFECRSGKDIRFTIMIYRDYWIHELTGKWVYDMEKKLADAITATSAASAADKCRKG